MRLFNGTSLGVQIVDNGFLPCGDQKVEFEPSLYTTRGATFGNSLMFAQLVRGLDGASIGCAAVRAFPPHQRHGSAGGGQHQGCARRQGHLSGRQLRRQSGSGPAYHPAQAARSGYP